MIGLHAFAMVVAFVFGGLITLWSTSTVGSDDRDLFGWSACGAGVMSLIVFAAALVLR